MGCGATRISPTGTRGTGAPVSRLLKLATVCVLQFLLGLSDRQAAETVRCRIDVKYAMAMELDDPGLHHSVLADFRDRLAEDDGADRLLDLALARLKEAGLVRERTTCRRTDFSHVYADTLRTHAGRGPRSRPADPGASPVRRPADRMSACAMSGHW
ncbi:transposase [Streptomyces lancefieldiae]|uniref:Transposase n=1 Tax=Streptomyces lancefieldiae TaxID=3075520 RepID=A0ABU3B167_9ACTN|nr:transposase [Streptomyces sp. DSM 40712]MDT0615918.1 transposase [Streptomyces sp. DSM 40712]